MAYDDYRFAGSFYRPIQLIYPMPFHSIEELYRFINKHGARRLMYNARWNKIELDDDQIKLYGQWWLERDEINRSEEIYNTPWSAIIRLVNRNLEYSIWTGDIPLHDKFWPALIKDFFPEFNRFLRREESHYEVLQAEK
jgi:hypothetical protein